MEDESKMLIGIYVWHSSVYRILASRYLLRKDRVMPLRPHKGSLIVKTIKIRFMVMSSMLL